MPRTLPNYSQPALITSISPTFGPPGTIVTISGLYLNQVLGINFGLVTTVNFTIVNQFTITVAAPVPNGNNTVVSVQVTSAFGESPLLPLLVFTYSMFETFNPSSGVNVSLTPDNLTASGSSQNNNSGVTVFAPQLFGKYYFEIKYNVIQPSNGGIAIAPLGTSFAGLCTGLHGSNPPVFSGGNGGLLVDVSGRIWINGTKQQTSGGADAVISLAMSSGDVIGVALDLNNGLVWFRVVDGPDVQLGSADWNGGVNGIGVGSSPFTGQLGYSIFPENVAKFVPILLINTDQPSHIMVMTANFGASPYKIVTNFIQKPPGFSNWPVV